MRFEMIEPKDIDYFGRNLNRPPAVTDCLDQYNIQHNLAVE